MREKSNAIQGEFLICNLGSLFLLTGIASQEGDLLRGLLYVARFTKTKKGFSFQKISVSRGWL